MVSGNQFTGHINVWGGKAGKNMQVLNNIRDFLGRPHSDCAAGQPGSTAGSGKAACFSF